MISRFLENSTQFIIQVMSFSNSRSAWTRCSAPLGPHCVVSHCECHLHSLPGVPMVCLISAFILHYIILYCFLFCFVFFTSIWFEVSVNIVETFRKTLISHCFYSLKEHKKKGETEPRGQNLHVAEEKRSLTRVWCHRTTSEVTQPNHSALIECSGRLHALICYIMFSVYLRFCNDGMLHFAFCMNLNGLTGSLLSSHHSQ